MWGLIILIAVVIVVGGCAVAFGRDSRAAVGIERKLEVDPSINVSGDNEITPAPSPKEKRK
jgi:hypothetical protein